jgi:hypothetical protein
MRCRNCNSKNMHSMIDLGSAPASNAYVKVSELQSSEVYTPLKVLICDNCKLVQTRDYFKENDLFTDEYAYLSSASNAWLEHCSKYCKMITNKLKLDTSSQVCEVASNDGYLLTNFLDLGINCFGIEPTTAAAKIGQKKGIPTIIDFLGESTAHKIVKDKGKSDLIIGNNVFAHVPDIRDFTKGLKILLKDEGSITLEFPHVLSLLEHNQFDTIYHEHFSYHSLIGCQNIFDNEDLLIYDVEKLDTHGGSLRLFVQHKNGPHTISKNLEVLLEKEYSYGLDKVETYLKLEEKALHIRDSLRKTISDIKLAGGNIVAYGAAAKGNTLLNFCGINHKDIDYVFDRSILKIGKFMPGSNIPILDASEITKYNFTHIMILPWNIKNEVLSQLKGQSITGKVITAIPEVIIEKI